MMGMPCCHCVWTPSLSHHKRFCHINPSIGSSGWINDYAVQEGWTWTPTGYEPNVPDPPPPAYYRYSFPVINPGETHYIDPITISLRSSGGLMGYGGPTSYINFMMRTSMSGNISVQPYCLPDPWTHNFGNFVNHGSSAVFTNGYWDHWPNWSMPQNEFFSRHNHSGLGNSDPIALLKLAPPISKNGHLGAHFTYAAMWIKKIQIGRAGDIVTHKVVDPDTGAERDVEELFSNPTSDNYRIVHEHASFLSDRHNNMTIPSLPVPSGVTIEPETNMNIKLWLAVSTVGSPYSQSPTVNQDDLVSLFFSTGHVKHKKLTGYEKDEYGVPDVDQPIYGTLEGDTGGGIANFVFRANRRFDPKEMFYRVRFHSGPRGGSTYPLTKQIDFRGDGFELRSKGVYKRLDAEEIGDPGHGNEPTISLEWGGEVPYLTHPGTKIKYPTLPDSYPDPFYNNNYWAPVDISNDGSVITSARQRWQYDWSSGEFGVVTNHTEYPNPFPVPWDGVSTQTFLLLEESTYTRRHNHNPTETITSHPRSSFETCRYAEVSTVLFDDLEE